MGPRGSLDGGKILPPLGFDPRTVQPVVRHYTDRATQPTNVVKQCSYLLQDIAKCRFSYCHEVLSCVAVAHGLRCILTFIIF